MMSFYQTVQPTDRAVFGRIFPPRPDWLAAAVAEEVLDPDLPIVDAHHHLWDSADHGYLLPELDADLATGHNIVATVHVDADSHYRTDGPEEFRPVGETEWVAQLTADRVDEIPTVARGIVGRADLTIGERVGEVLDAHLAVGDGRFRGVRMLAAWDADPTIGSPAVSRPGMLLEPGTVLGARELASRGLTLDAWIFHPQLPDLPPLLDAVPELTVVLGHLGGPLGYGVYADKKQLVFKQWRTDLARIAARPNVTVKLGGVMMRLAAFDYIAAERPLTSQELADLWHPYVETCIELFGPRRCMFESNFPVEKMGTPYATLWNAFKRMTAAYSGWERTELFSATAIRTYRLDEELAA